MVGGSCTINCASPWCVSRKTQMFWWKLVWRWLLILAPLFLDFARKSRFTCVNFPELKFIQNQDFCPKIKKESAFYNWKLVFNRFLNFDQHLFPKYCQIFRNARNFFLIKGISKDNSTTFTVLPREFFFTFPSISHDWCVVCSKSFTIVKSYAQGTF